MKKLSILILTIIILNGCNSKPPNIPKVYNDQFKYADLTVSIPDEEELSNFEDFFQPEESVWNISKDVYPFKYICKDGKKSIKATIVKSTSKSRTAVICDNQYIIQEFTLALGPILFGPYTIEN